MAFKHFTKCVKPADFEPRSFIGMGAIATFITGPFIAAFINQAIKHPGKGHGFCAVIAALLGLVIFLVAYCENWLFKRLICLGGDRDAIGLLVENSPPKFEILDWDNDYSINLLLQCTELGVTEDSEELRDSPFGELIRNQSEILDLVPKVPGYKNNGYIIHDDLPVNTDSVTLHCEFEGSGVHDLNVFAKAMVGILTGALILCALLPQFGWLIALIAALLTLLGLGLTKVTHPGSPADVNPELPELKVGVHILYIVGTWVYDPLHDGYNEIHPIKVCTIQGFWSGQWDPADCGSGPGVILLRLRQAFQEAQSEETRANQALPQHQWHFHPAIDGCAPVIIL